MHAFHSYIFAARNACDSGPTCLPLHSPDFLHELQLFFVFIGHVGFNFGIVCLAKLASSQFLTAH